MLLCSIVLSAGGTTPRSTASTAAGHLLIQGLCKRYWTCFAPFICIRLPWDMRTKGKSGTITCKTRNSSSSARTNGAGLLFPELRGLMETYRVQACHPLQPWDILPEHPQTSAPYDGLMTATTQRLIITIYDHKLSVFLHSRLRAILPMLKLCKLCC